jgi:hypothetical protein
MMARTCQPASANISRGSAEDRISSADLQTNWAELKGCYLVWDGALPTAMASSGRDSFVVAAAMCTQDCWR